MNCSQVCETYIFIKFAGGLQLCVGNNRTILDVVPKIGNFASVIDFCSQTKTTEVV